MKNQQQKKVFIFDLLLFWYAPYSAGMVVVFPAIFSPDFALKLRIPYFSDIFKTLKFFQIYMRLVDTRLTKKVEQKVDKS
jgi:hypothetical protein